MTCWEVEFYSTDGFYSGFDKAPANYDPRLPATWVWDTYSVGYDEVTEVQAMVGLIREVKAGAAYIIVFKNTYDHFAAWVWNKPVADYTPNGHAEYVEIKLHKIG